MNCNKIKTMQQNENIHFDQPKSSSIHWVRLRQQNHVCVNNQHANRLYDIACVNNHYRTVFGVDRGIRFRAAVLRCRRSRLTKFILLRLRVLNLCQVVSDSEAIDIEQFVLRKHHFHGGHLDDRSFAVETHVDTFDQLFRDCHSKDRPCIRSKLHN